MHAPLILATFNVYLVDREAVRVRASRYERTAKEYVFYEGMRAVRRFNALEVISVGNALNLHNHPLSNQDRSQQ